MQDNSEQKNRNWKLYIKDEYYRPPVKAYADKEHSSKDKAFEQAYQLMYGVARRAHCKVLWIEGPSGKIDQDQIDDYCTKRAAVQKEQDQK
jgi:hypothetical protein